MYFVICSPQSRGETGSVESPLRRFKERIKETEKLVLDDWRRLGSHAVTTIGFEGYAW
jgi:hypothetical protein